MKLTAYDSVLIMVNYMIFVTFLFGVLKIIGLIIFGILVFIITAVCLIIFVPVRFELRASGLENFIFHLDMSWFFKAVKYHYYVTDSEKTGLLLFGHDPGNFFKKKSMKKNDNKKNDFTNKDKNEEKTDFFHAENKNRKNADSEYIEKENNLQRDNVNISVKEQAFYNHKKKKSADKKKNKNKKSRFKKNKLKREKSKNGIFEIIDKIKNYPDKDKIINYTLILLKRLKNAIRFKAADIYGTIGFDDPSQTGLFLGAAGIISAFLPIDFNIKGNFEKEYFNAGVYLNGSFSLWSIGFPVAVYILKKPIRKILFERNDDIE